jgi:hypothetical protein
VRIFAKVVRGPIPRVQKAITLRTAITISAGIEAPIPCVQFVFLGVYFVQASLWFLSDLVLNIFDQVFESIYKTWEN